MRFGDDKLKAELEGYTNTIIQRIEYDKDNPDPVTKGFLDDLEAHGIVLNLGETKIAMISVDSCEFMTPLVNRYRAAIEKHTGIKAENIFLSCTHTHTGPLIQPTDAFEALTKNDGTLAKILIKIG